ncbi:MAG: nuclear transport factor 2 family protein [Caldilineales bacterium]
MSAKAGLQVTIKAMTRCGCASTGKWAERRPGTMADTATAKVTVQQFWAAVQANDWRAAAELLHDDYVLEWPQSGEIVRGRENFAAINANYPAAGRWRFNLHRIVCEGDQVVTDVSVTDGAIAGQAITFSTVRDGRIVHQMEFWPDPFEPAPWRAQWVERTNDLSGL